MSASAADYAWFRDHELHEMYCMTLVRGLTPTEFLARLGATPHGISQGFAPFAWENWEVSPDHESYGAWWFIGATQVSGPDAPWTLAVEINGYLGTLSEHMAPVSAGTRAVSHFRNINALTSFDWWEDGELRMYFEWPEGRQGSTPDALVDAMARVGFGLGDEDGDPGIPGKMALAEELTGVRVTAEILRDATYTTGVVGDIHPS
ncbi:DUF6461 domain-containing protein [Streptomyces sp. RTd22]|uniref:DUF6461 domain-containing protein n=1 Tax=Streptomyces sp. RTd22 TaxID=1841249 RepID=UPI0007C4C9C5|nr:DUF6461 domain-containing protein [Streptomyces sp. RTd22]